MAAQLAGDSAARAARVARVARVATRARLRAQIDALKRSNPDYDEDERLMAKLKSYRADLRALEEYKQDDEES